MMFIVSALVLASVIFMLTGRRFLWLQFFVKGKESGFLFREIFLLRKVALENQVQDPSSLFWSLRQLDSSIRGVIDRQRVLGTEEDEATIRFIGKLFEFRKKVEFFLPRYRMGLKSTRNITPIQDVLVTFPGGGVYRSSITENMKKHLTITCPGARQLPPEKRRKGASLSVYFRRMGDAGYYFETRVLDDFLVRNAVAIRLAHSSRLERTQMRRFHRTPVNRPSTLFILRDIAQADEIWEERKGLRCLVINISEGGMAVLIGGRARTGVPIKVQVSLIGKRIVMCGIVKRVSYDSSKNLSVIHMEAVAPNETMRNNILMYVYGIFTAEGPAGTAEPEKAAMPVSP